MSLDEGREVIVDDTQQIAYDGRGIQTTNN